MREQVPQVSGMSNEFIQQRNRNILPQPYYGTPSIGVNPNLQSGLTFMPSISHPSSYAHLTVPLNPPNLPYTIPSLPHPSTINHEDLDRLYEKIKLQVNKALKYKVDMEDPLPLNFKTTIKEVIREVIREELPTMVNTDADPLRIRSQCKEIERKVMEQYAILKRDLDEYKAKQETMNAKMDMYDTKFSEQGKMTYELQGKLKNVNKRVTENIEKNKRRYLRTIKELTDVREKTRVLKSNFEATKNIIYSDVITLYELIENKDAEFTSNIEEVKRNLSSQRLDQNKFTKSIESLYNKIGQMEIDGIINGDNVERINNIVSKLQENQGNIKTLSDLQKQELDKLNSSQLAAVQRIETLTSTQAEQGKSVEKARDETRTVAQKMFETQGANNTMFNEIFQRLGTVEGVQRQFQETFNNMRQELLQNMTELQKSLGTIKSQLFIVFTEIQSRLSKIDTSISTSAQEINNIQHDYTLLKQQIDKEIIDRGLDKSYFDQRFIGLTSSINALYILYRGAVKRIEMIENRPLTTALMGTASDIQATGASVASGIYNSVTGYGASLKNTVKSIVGSSVPQDDKVVKAV